MAPAQAGWEVQWIDAFEGEGVNWDNWTAQIQANYNNEIQCYTDNESSLQKNYDVSDGTLKIIARRQDIACPGLGNQQREWTSGRLNSKDKREFLYGRIETRLRFLNLEGGTWPAFWMLENRIAEHPIRGDNDTVNWPNAGAGEIDVWEWFSNDGGSYITNFFNVNGCGSEFRPTYAGGAADVQDFHTYAIEWSADQVSFFMDGNVVKSHDISACPQYKEPMFLLLNVAIGGNLGGAVDASLMQATMEVDYVAHCTTADNSATGCNQTTPISADDDGDGVGNSLDQCHDTPAGTSVDINGCADSQVTETPTTAAPTPTPVASDVIALFSDAYNEIDGVNFNPDWGQSTIVTQPMLNDDEVLMYTGLNYQGTDYDGNHQDVSGMTHLHVDYWTSSSTALSVYLISPGPQETPYPFAVEQHQWISTDIPLSTFTAVDLTDTFQLKVEGNGSVYLDNIYFVNLDGEPAVIDSDSDGVTDAQDSCDNTTVGAIVDANGCENFAPTVNLIARQDGSSVSQIDRTAGVVSVSATVADANAGDSHQYQWQFNTEWVAETASSFSFDPNDLDTENVSITVTVSDDGEPVKTAQQTLQLAIQTSQDDTGSTDTGDSANQSGSGGSSWGLLGLIGLLCLGTLRHALNTCRFANSSGRSDKPNTSDVLDFQ
ncbi:glycoside hydrolase family 16 protein [Neiella holothuriorum]|uniref:glycoside hydrolase family 16 protein n=1 Tax=Neiella holothuriorum TaxID=2870530 RepID=UPI00298FA8C2|nr:glycoside hydrolase family 16 protein [Neiella holothuriorum]